MSDVDAVHYVSVDNTAAMTPAQPLFPRIMPYHSAELPVSEIHTVYYEISGNPAGLPVVFIHGGPGGGTFPGHRRFFDPDVYKIILFDQRGCGKSRPYACLQQNSTWDLVDDMERIRVEANVESWVLFGGSWGSTLALTYAQMYPHRVVGLILRGIFLARAREVTWLFERHGAAMLYPEAFQNYIAGLPEELRGADSLVKAFYSVLAREEDDAVRRAAANSWCRWENALSSFPREGEEDEEGDLDEEENLAISRLECHYFMNNCFFKKDGFLLGEEQMSKIKHIKTCIVQGRWDMVCPRTSAYDLSKMFDAEAVEMTIVEQAGHSTFEPGIEQALLKACEEFGKEFGWMGTQGANG